MNKKRRPWLVLIVCVLGVSLSASTKATAAYVVASSPQPSPHPSVGVLFSNGFTFYYHGARHHAHVRPAGVEEPPVPADFFDRK